MTKHRKILTFIERIRESHSLMVPIFTQGSCLNFHVILREVYPESKAYFNIDHFVTRIDDRYYDITGEVKDVSSYSPFSEWYGKDTMIRSFRRQYRGELNLLPYNTNP